MTTSAISAKATDVGHVRPLNIFTDLPSVADMIETCFAGLLDADGQAAVNDIRRQGGDKGFLAWAPRMVDSISLPLSGFVYELNSKLVGNVSLIPYNRYGQRNFLIANVATLPDHRRKGIARVLTEAAIARAFERGAQQIWLQVREDNPGAIGLYEQLGFSQKYTNNTWLLPPEYKISSEPDATFQVRRTQSQEWPAMLQAYKQVYPSELDWYYGYHLENFKPGILPGLQRILRDERVSQLTAVERGKPVAGISVRNVIGMPEHIFATRPFNGSANSLLALFAGVKNMLDVHKKQVFEYPPSEFDPMIFNAGFIKQRTLVWMRYEGIGSSVQKMR